MRTERGPRRARDERPPQRGRFVSVRGIPCHVLTRGHGTPVLLLHGNGSRGEEILSAFPTVRGIRWIAPDRPGFGFSAALPDGCQDPVSQAEWIRDLMDALGVRSATIVAHSLAAGAATVLAAASPSRVGRLVLLSPFCRPTPERWMPALRLASAPLIGSFVRKVVLPPLVRRLRLRLLCKLMTPNRLPVWLESLPLSHAANPRAVRATALELKSFNAAMRRVSGRLRLHPPVIVVHGLADRTAAPDWHLPWLRRRAPGMRSILVPNCGHSVHHAAPEIVLGAILDGGGRGRCPTAAACDGRRNRPACRSGGDRAGMSG